MNRTAAIAAVGSAVFAVSYSIGFLALVEPEQETETVTREVEVPGPTVTVTETVTEEVVPQSCLDAIDSAEDVGRDMGTFSGIMVGYPDLISRALEAGINMDVAAVDAIARDVRAGSRKTRRVTRSLSTHVDEFNTAKTQCRAKGE